MFWGVQVVTGRVETINPLSTIIRDDDGVPITIPNTVSGEDVSHSTSTALHVQLTSPTLLC